MFSTSRFVVLSAVIAVAANANVAPTPQRLVTSLNEQAVLRLAEPKADLCKPCISFAGDALQQLLNIILNGVVSQSCNKLCTALENATHSKPVGTTCLLLCEVVGIKAFINWVEHADLSPIYDCEQLGICKTNDYGDASITTFEVTPPVAPQSTDRTINFAYTSKNGTGTGEIRLSIKTVDHQSLSFPSIYLPNSLTGGSQSGTGTVQTNPAPPGCDPTQSQCEMWLPGTYQVSLEICEGECGDTKHPHAKLYDAKNTTFVIGNGPAPPSPPGPSPPPSPGGKHYEDPTGGSCSPDEKAVQINGIQGAFCSPSCSTTSPCPTDVPDGAAARPVCALETPPSKTPTQCALICQPGLEGPDAQCPDKASCKKIQNTGICTYDS